MALKALGVPTYQKENKHFSTCTHFITSKYNKIRFLKFPLESLMLTRSSTFANPHINSYVIKEKQDACCTLCFQKIVLNINLYCLFDFHLYIDGSRAVSLQSTCNYCQIIRSEIIGGCKLCLLHLLFTSSLLCGGIFYRFKNEGYLLEVF